MQSYVVSSGGKPFDWEEFLKRTDHTSTEIEWAVMESGSWVTCACGNQCAEIPRNYDGTPDDDELRYLGLRFHQCMLYWDDNHTVDYHRLQALECLKAIEKRSSELLALIRGLKKHEI